MCFVNVRVGLNLALVSTTLFCQPFSSTEGLFPIIRQINKDPLPVDRTYMYNSSIACMCITAWIGLDLYYSSLVKLYLMF